MTALTTSTVPIGTYLLVLLTTNQRARWNAWSQQRAQTVLTERRKDLPGRDGVLYSVLLVRILAPLQWDTKSFGYANTAKNVDFDAFTIQAPQRLSANPLPAGTYMIGVPSAVVPELRKVFGDLNRVQANSVRFDFAEDITAPDGTMRSWVVFTLARSVNWDDARYGAPMVIREPLSSTLSTGSNSVASSSSGSLRFVVGGTVVLAVGIALGAWLLSRRKARR
jgi:hypothetical protein